MKLREVVDTLGLEVVVGSVDGVEVTGAYASDMLSDVMAHAKAGSIWVTLQIHQNVIAVAVLKELAAVLIVGARRPEDDMAEKAEREGIPVLVTPLTAFEIAGRLYEMGLRGSPAGEGV